MIFDPAVLHRAISEKSRANIHFRFKKRSSNKIKLNLFNDYSLVISKEWRDVLDNSPKVFDETILEKEFEWHRDENKRFVTVIYADPSNTWQFQFDEDIPFEMVTGDKIEIPKGFLHRVIKGKGNLKIKIYKQ